MAGWTPKENAYCLIRLLDWRAATLEGKEQIISEGLKTGLFTKHETEAEGKENTSLRQHFYYLDKLIAGEPVRKVDKDQYLVGIYKKRCHENLS